jgi:iron(III) transport system substrate-binding protein
MFLSSASAQPARADWQSEWNKTVKAAKKEGRLVLYGGEEITHPEITNEFMKKYPGIKVVTGSGRGSTLGPRILAERRAKKYLVDLFSGGPSTPYRVLYRGKVLDPIEPTFILPEVTDKSKWYRGRHYYADPKDAYLFIFEGSVSRGASLAYNTNIVDPNEFKSYYDILNPKWKGKISFYNPTASGGGLNSVISLYNNPKLGPKFIRRLFGEMDVTIFRSRRQGPDWLATGKYPLCFSCRDMTRAKRQGLPVNQVPPENFKEMEPVIGGGSSSVIVLINRAPHPNAARVFINWYLSREGQITWQRAMNTTVAEASDSLRIDIPKDDVLADSKRQEGVKYRVIAFRDPRPSIKLMREILRK